MQWYFDFISPFAYLQSTRLAEFQTHETVTCVPVLFAGLLNHWDNVGPAEIAPKRRWTFEHCIWIAERDGIDFTLPEYHPFNPLPLLRLSIALGNDLASVQRIFRYVWVEGHVPQDIPRFNALLAEFSMDSESLNTDNVKSTLRSNGEQAVQAGVFGVPTIRRADRLFWGYDATDMAHAHRSGEQWPTESLEKIQTFAEGPGRNRK